MKRDHEVSWGRLGRIEKVFLVLMAIWALLYFTGLAQKFQTLTAIAAIVMGVAAIIKIGRMAMRNLIWRLRNRLIVAYLFIAVVPIVLILALMLVTSYALIGQMAVYLVNRELENRMRTLSFPAETLTRAPAPDTQTALTRALPMLRHGFPEFEMLATGEQTFRYPPDARLTAPPEPWKNASGLIIRKDGRYRSPVCMGALRAGRQRSDHPGADHGRTAERPGAGNRRRHLSRVHPAVRKIARAAQGELAGYRSEFSLPRIRAVVGESAGAPPQRLYIVVDTRYSAVLGIVFGQKADWSERGDDLSHDPGIHLPAGGDGVPVGRRQADAAPSPARSTSCTKARSTCSEGDFSYRIPVKGNDQIAELGSSFNTMTENLGRLIVVAKEKERLESELAIARDVQNQLFPKDVPFTKIAGIEGRLQSGAHGVGRLLRFHGAARRRAWPSPSATWPAREFRRRC